MTRAERIKWQAVVEAYELPIIEAARAEGRIPVIDYTVDDCPIPQHVLDALAIATDPARLDQLRRTACSLRAKAGNLLSLAEMLRAKGDAKGADKMEARAAAVALEAQRMDIEAMP